MSEHHEHFILDIPTMIKVFIGLLIGTVITVLASKVDLGILNFPVAMIIATGKASLVVFFFMGMKADSLENKVIFFGSFIFVAIFIILTMADTSTRDENVYTNRTSQLQSVNPSTVVGEN